MNIARPGYQLLSLYNRYNAISDFSNEVTYGTTDCLLPDQIGIYTRLYLRFVFITFGIIGFLALRKAFISYRSNQITQASKHRHSRSQSRTYVHGRSFSHHDLVSSESESSGDDEFGYLSTPTSSGPFMYHTNEDDDGLPTPVASPVYQSRVWRKARPVRRVSRVYLWDKRRGGGGSTPLSKFTGSLIPWIVLRPIHWLLRVLAPFLRPLWQILRAPVLKACRDIIHVARWPLALYIVIWLHFYF